MTVSAFEYAWSVLKALPEQQAFSQHMDIPRNYQAPVRHSRYRDGYIRQNRRGTVPPPIIGMMGREQGLPYRTRMNVVPEGDAEIRGQLVDKPENIRDFPPNTDEVTPTTMPEDLRRIEDRAQIDRGTLFHDYKPRIDYDYGSPDSNMGFTTGFKIRKPKRPEWHLDHPPKQPLDTDAMYAYLQSIGF